MFTHYSPFACRSNQPTNNHPSLSIHLFLYTDHSVSGCTKYTKYTTHSITTQNNTTRCPTPSEPERARATCLPRNSGNTDPSTSPNT
mmetsp:Transcript_19478/g.54290  ORF Transcript_19478/g.54290 Transcript_19478/m.54290 type:complete len:87 (+) Transcript_19478:715-975(+)